MIHSVTFTSWQIKTIFFIIILIAYSEVAFGYSKEMNDIQTGYYLGETNTYILIDETIASGTSNVEKQTYKNIIAVMRMRAKLEPSRATYNMIKKTLAENEPLLSKSDPNYITSVADLMISFIEFSTLPDVMVLSANADELYQKALKINPNHFGALIGLSISTSFRPRFIGGGLDKSMPIFKKAEMNAKENWEKHLIYIWLSQAYMEMNDNANYKKYIKLAEAIYPDGSFLNIVKKKNSEGNTMFDRKYN